MHASQPAPSANPASAKSPWCRATFTLCGWFLAVLLAILAAYLWMECSRSRTETSLARLETELAESKVVALRQQLEAEHLLTAAQIEMIRNATQPVLDTAK